MPPIHMVHCSYFNSHNLLRYDKSNGRGVTVVSKDKGQHTTLGNLAMHRLITTMFKPDLEHTHTHIHTYIHTHTLN